MTCRALTRRRPPALPPPPLRDEDDLEGDLVEDADGGAQVVEALEAGDGEVLLQVRLLVEVPAAGLGAVAGEEDLDGDAAARGGDEVHAQAQRLAAAEGVREGLAAPAVVDVLVAVVAVHAQAAAVPARQTEWGVRRGRVAERERDLVARVLQDVDFVVDGLAAARGDGAVRRHAVQRRVGGQTGVGGVGLGLAAPDADALPVQGPPVEGRCEHVDVARVHGVQLGQSGGDRVAQGELTAPLLTGFGLLLGGIVGGRSVEAAEEAGRRREQRRVGDGDFPVVLGVLLLRRWRAGRGGVVLRRRWSRGRSEIRRPPTSIGTRRRRTGRRRDVLVERVVFRRRRPRRQCVVVRGRRAGGGSVLLGSAL